MRITDQRAVWNKLRDDQKFQLFVELTDAAESNGDINVSEDEAEIVWDNGDKFTETVVRYSVSDLSRL